MRPRSSASRSGPGSKPLRTLSFLGAFLALSLVAPAPAQEAEDAAGAEGARVLVISYDRVMRETAAGRAIREAEDAARSAYEAAVEEAQVSLAAEEAELTRLRGELDRETFARRTEAFDARVRAVRRESQRRAAELQQIFRTAREALRAEVAPILVEVLRDRDADIVLDADQILVAAPRVDVTEAVIARFDAEVPPPEIEIPPQAPWPDPGAGAASDPGLDDAGDPAETDDQN